MHTKLVHVVDDDPVFRQYLQMMLDAKGFVVHEYECGQVFVDSVNVGAVGCALVDVNMPGMSGLEVQEKLNASAITLPVIIMTGQADVPTAVAAMKAGAVDFIEKPFRPPALLAAIEEAMGREQAQDDNDSQVTAFRMRLTELTEREREVLEGIVAGFQTKAIAFKLDISPRTVAVHRTRIGDKLRISGLSNLVRIALAAGLSVGAPWRPDPTR
jgi:two-component system, LuxR family, response regulator FixJ